MAEVIADPDDATDARGTSEGYAEISTVEEVDLKHVGAVRPPEAAEPRRGGQRPRPVQRRDAESEHGAVGRLQRAAFVVLPIEQYQGRLDPRTIQDADQREQLRLRPAAGETIDQETDANRAAMVDRHHSGTVTPRLELSEGSASSSETALPSLTRAAS